MNLDDLRAELDAHANDLDTHATGRMAGIRAKVAQRRRRKAGATVAASVLAVGAIVAVPAVNQLSAGPEPAKQAPFPEKIDGDTMIASTMGDEGDTTVTLEFTPEDTDFLLKLECDALAPQGNGVAARDRASALYVAVNEQTVGVPCGRYDDHGATTGLVGGAATRDDVRDFWAQGAVRAGGPVTVTLRVREGPSERKRTKPIDGRIGLAVYDMTGDRIESDGAALPEQKTINGDRYELGGYEVAGGSAMTASLDVPALDSPGYVMHGATRGYLGTSGRVTVDGRHGRFSDSVGVLTEEMSDAGEHTLKIRDSAGKGPGASVVLAYYTRVDASDEDDDADAMFPSTLDGDQRIDSVMLDDDGWTTLTIDPHDLKFQWALACNATVTVDVEIKGYTMSWLQRCRPSSLGERPMRGQVGNAFSPGYLAEKRGKDLDPDDPVTIRARIDDVEKAPDGGGGPTVALAAYDMSGARTIVGDVGLPMIKDVDGRQYELADYETEPTASEQRSFNLDLPAAETPGLLVHGTPTQVENKYDLDASESLGLHGSTGSGFRTDRLQAQPASTVTMTVQPQGKSVGGPSVLAYYRPVDDSEDTNPPELSFPDVNDNRDPLVDSRVGEPGETVFRTSLTPESANSELVIACDYDFDPSRPVIRFTVEVNGLRIDDTRCRPQTRFKLTDLPALRDVAPGQPLDVVIHLDRSRISEDTASGVTLGAALYECSADRVEVNGFLLPREYRHEGDWYELAESDSVNVEPGTRRVALRREASNEPIVVASSFVEPGKGWGQTWVDGKRIDYSLESDLLRFNPVSGSSQRLVSHAIGRYDGGRLLIAYYVPES